MKSSLSFFFLFLILLSSCENYEKSNAKKSISILKQEFEKQITTNSHLEEGPFSFNYKYRTVFASGEVFSLFGELTVLDRLPHGWQKYEGKTLYKNGNNWEEVYLKDLFQTKAQKELLRSACEDQLKNGVATYFSGDSPMYMSLSPESIHTFVVDHKDLIIIFDPYSVGGCIDGPHIAKIPLNTLQNKWKINHPIFSLISNANETKAYISCWNPEDAYKNTEIFE